MKELLVIEALKKAHLQSRGEFSFESIMTDVALGNAHLIDVDGLYAILRINVYETYKACCIQLCGGILNATNFKKGLALIEQFAKDNGCKTVEVYGREGWKKLLPTLGYVPIYTVLEKTLEVL